MCGRFSLVAISQVLSDRFKVEINDAIKPRYNIAPGQETLVILNENQDNAVLAKWGLIPPWAKDKEYGYSMINARVETITEKVSYKESFKYKRCLVLADGFYEWKQTPGGKIPYRITLRNQQPFTFAGIYSLWEKDDEKILSFSIITVNPNEIVAPIHDRMPAILQKKNEEIWLNGPYSLLMNTITPYPGEDMKAFEISTKVNNPENDFPELIEPKEEKKLSDYW